MSLSQNINVDDEADVVTIHGIRYAGELFRNMLTLPLGARFRIVDRRDGVVTLTRDLPDAPGDAD